MACYRPVRAVGRKVFVKNHHGGGRLIRHLMLAAPLALGLLSAHAHAAGKTPPPALADYVAAVRKADAIGDPLQRCLAYPDLPGNTWAPDVAKTRCSMFNTPPMFTLDTLEQALAQPDGANAVDAKFKALLEAHFTAPEQREQIFIAYWPFKTDARIDDAERIARAWVKAAPDSAFARTALGHVLANRGWNARGSKYMADTPQENVRRMEQFFEEAATEYVAAFKAEPTLLPACVALMSIGRQSSDGLQAQATSVCLDIDPKSYYVIDEWMTASEPRWGGSLEQMRHVAAYAQARAADNPALALFAYAHAAYEIDRAEDDDARTLQVLEPAARRVPNAGLMRNVGGAYLRKGDYWNAFVYLSQALRFSPDYAQESRWRAHVLFMLDEKQWARADAERAVALEPANARHHSTLADILRDTVGPDPARPHYARAMEDPKVRENAFVEYCWAWMNAQQRKESVECVDDLIAEFPQNGEAWRMRLFQLGPDAPQSVETMRRFLATQNPERWPRHKVAAETVRKFLAEKGLEE